MDPTTSFAAFKAALHAEHAAKDSIKTGEYATLIFSLLKIKDVNRDISIRVLEAHDASILEKERAESIQLRLENLLFKRSHLLTEISQLQDISTPFTDAVAEDITKTLSSRTYTTDLKKRHDQVLKLLMVEQINRKTDKLALEHKRKEHEQLLAKLDSRRRYLDDDLQKTCVQLSADVKSAAKIFDDQSC
jgi:hypothetical protein